MSQLSTKTGFFVWEWHDGSYDRAKLNHVEDGWIVSGRHGDIRYVVDLSTDFTCRSLEASCGDETLSIRNTPGGWRDVRAGVLPDTKNIDFLDLGWSAVSNTFPIRRMSSQDLENSNFDVLMITEPDLKPTVVRQSYRKLSDTWLYANLETGYTAELTIDPDGFVVEYPDLCSRKDLST